MIFHHPKTAKNLNKRELRWFGGVFFPFAALPFFTFYKHEILYQPLKYEETGEMDARLQCQGLNSGALEPARGVVAR